MYSFAEHGDEIIHWLDNYPFGRAFKRMDMHVLDKP